MTRKNLTLSLLTAFIFDFTSLGVVGVLVELHRTGNVVVYPETERAKINEMLFYHP